MSNVVERVSRVVKRELSTGLHEGNNVKRVSRVVETECKQGSKHMLRRCQEGVKRVPNGCE